MIRRTFLFGAATALTTLVGCGPSNPDGSGGPPSFLSAFERSNIKVACRNLVECPQGQRSPFGFQSRFDSVSACEAAVRAGRIPAPFGDLERAIEDGRILVDEDGLSDCIDQLNARLAALPACADVGDLRVEACEALLSGTVEESGACLLDDECAGDAVCVGGGECPVGTLRTQPPGYDVGCFTECFDENACGAGEECRTFNGGAIAICLSLDGSSPPNVPATCYGQCVSAAGSCGDDCPEPLGEGDACTTTDDCTRDSPFVGCLEGTCTAFWSSTEGQACGFDGDFCAFGLQCALDTEICQAPEELVRLAAGETCFPGQDFCALGLACTGFDANDSQPIGTCAAYKQSGEECFIFSECASDLTCVGAVLEMSPPSPGACGALLTDGASCRFDPECASGVCEDNQCASEEVCALP